jgi:hypothetical protein
MYNHPPEGGGKTNNMDLSIYKETIMNKEQNLDNTQNQQLNIAGVVCSCYMCGKSIEQPEEQFDMYGEIVCQSCWDYNMYQALQDGGGM